MLSLVVPEGHVVKIVPVLQDSRIVEWAGLLSDCGLGLSLEILRIVYCLEISGHDLGLLLETSGKLVNATVLMY